MYCKECGAELSNDESKFCTSCGVKKENGNKFCQACGTERVNPNQEVCLNCGVEFKKVGNGDKKKTPALLLALFLGGFGAHLFYVGRAGKAMLYIALTLSGFLTCGVTTIIAGVLEIIDIVFICTDKFTDSEGNILSEWN
ncbi:NINE protein [uncultured Clostridium sp.]|uniref:NINE protein n=1 Tax=uncultured Clostridium sp. TaxID=59620 RepID=UPI00260B25BA|nr:NINE protein [uncultured Clostridium sp.]